MRDLLRREETMPARLEGTAAPLAEQRSAPRFTLLIRAAKLITPDGEFLCVIRDASESGISARIFHPLPDCDEMLLELQNGDRYEVKLIWQDDDRAGFRFAGPADISRIVECPSRYSKRAIRLMVGAPAEVVSAGHVELVTIEDISQQGAKITCSCGFSIDQRVRLRAPGLPETNAKVRWRKDGTCGLVFEDTYQFGEIARIAQGLQRHNQAGRN